MIFNPYAVAYDTTGVLPEDKSFRNDLMGRGGVDHLDIWIIPDDLKF
jgi:hypothetical protein